MAVDSSKIVAVLTLIILLAVAAVGTLIWMAITGWADQTGLGVGIIYVVLTVIQVAFSYGWYRVVKKHPSEEQPSEPVELKSISPSRRVSGDRIANRDMKTESPLLNRSGSNGRMETA